jgi:hypothetical protein
LLIITTTAFTPPTTKNIFKDVAKVSLLSTKTKAKTSVVVLITSKKLIKDIKRV